MGRAASPTETPRFRYYHLTHWRGRWIPRLTWISYSNLSGVSKTGRKNQWLKRSEAGRLLSPRGEVGRGGSSPSTSTRTTTHEHYRDTYSHGEHLP